MTRSDRIDSRYAPEIAVDKTKKQSPFERVALAHANSRGSAETKWLYTKDVENWIACCARHGTNPSKPTIETATAFRDELAAKVKPATLRRTLAALSRMYRAAINARPQGANWNPFDADALTRPPPSTMAKTQSITDEQVELVIAEAERDKVNGVRNVAIIRLLYETGLRISSVMALERHKLFRRGATLIARTKAKKKDEVEIEIPKAAAEALERWLAVAPESDYVFPSVTNTRLPLARRSVSVQMKAYGKTVGVLRVHPHRFRAAYITTALDAGVPLHEIQAAVHHSDPSMTLRYDRGVRGVGVADAVAKFREKREK